MEILSKTLSRTGIYYGSMRDIGSVALYAEANELACRGVEEGAAQIQITIPESMDKSRLNSIRNHMDRSRKCLETKGFTIESFQVKGWRNRALLVPSVTITMMGKVKDRELFADAAMAARAGWDILLAGWIGLEGMLRIVGEREAQLRERFTPAFIRQIKSYGNEICGLDKIKAVRGEGIVIMRQISEGGIFAALWELAVETELGLKLDLKKFAIRQETIEICEFYRLNPYQLTSNGSFLMLAEHGEAAAGALRQKGIQAAVIGQLTDNNDKVIYNGEDVRYIDRPAPDELMKIFPDVRLG